MTKDAREKDTIGVEASMRLGYDLPGMNKQITSIPSREEIHKTKDPVEKESKGDTNVTSLKNKNKQDHFYVFT